MINDVPKNGLLLDFLRSSDSCYGICWRAVDPRFDRVYGTYCQRNGRLVGRKCEGGSDEEACVGDLMRIELILKSKYCENPNYEELFTLNVIVGLLSQMTELKIGQNRKLQLLALQSTTMIS